MFELYITSTWNVDKDATTGIISNGSSVSSILWRIFSHSMITKLNRVILV